VEIAAGSPALLKNRNRIAIAISLRFDRNAQVLGKIGGNTNEKAPDEPRLYSR
jgi:hypothetical protein